MFEKKEIFISFNDFHLLLISIMLVIPDFNMFALQHLKSNSCLGCG